MENQYKEINPFTKKETRLIKDYAEGHDLTLVYEEGMYKLEDLQERGSYWACGIKDVIQWLSDANESLIDDELKKENYSMEILNSLRKDEEKIGFMWDKINTFLI